MANSTNTLQATITATDNNNLVPISRSLNNPSYAGAFGQLSSFLNVPTAAADLVLNMPSTPVLQLYVKNLAAAGSGQVLTVKWTPNGGAQATIIALQPQGIILFWGVAAGGGVTAVSLNPSVNNLPAEVFLGG